MSISTVRYWTKTRSILFRRMAAETRALSIASNGGSGGVSFAEIPKSNTFTSILPPDPVYSSPAASHNAPRENLGPRMVKGALYTFVRPEKAEQPELLAVSRAALKDIGLKEEEEHTKDFRDTVSGNKLFWDEKTQEGIYPWAQCYGGE